MKLVFLGGAHRKNDILYSELGIQGHSVTVLDNLSKYGMDLLTGSAKFIFSDVRDERLTQRVLKDENPDILIWNISMRLDSKLENPRKIFENLEVFHLGIVRTLSAAKETQVKQIIFIVDEGTSSELRSSLEEVQNDFQLFTNSKIHNINKIEDIWQFIKI